MLQGVHPAVAARVRLMLEAWNAAGYPLVVTSGYRSAAHQASLIRAGMTQARQSRHVRGLAVDLGFAGYSTKDVPETVWRALGRYGEALGLRWGGRFSDYDPVHFDAG